MLVPQNAEMAKFLLLLIALPITIIVKDRDPLFFIFPHWWYRRDLFISRI